MNDQPFNVEQQEYLKGFMAGVEAKQGPLALGAVPAPDPADLQRAAQDRQVAAGGKLVPEEEAKRKKHPLDRFGEISALAAEGKFPKGTDVFLTKYRGLFFVAPAQNSFMCRLRMPGGILSSQQFRGVAAIAEQLGGGFADVTTRANLQVREIAAAAAPEVLTRLVDLGLTSQGAGADNVRNVTGSPTAGIDAQELIDTRPDARRIHHHILNHRELYGLPRKFNIAFDGSGSVPVLEDTNDIAFTAVPVLDGFGVAPGVYYRLALGGITGHKDFARATGVVVTPADTTPVCDAILRVFIAHGNRTDRTKARLKYLLDDWGHDKFLAAVEEELGRTLTRVPHGALGPAPPQSPLRPCRRAPPGAARPVLRRDRAAGRPHRRRADARAGRHRRAVRLRHDPADRLAEPADLRHRGRAHARRAGRHRGAGLGPRSRAAAHRAGRLHGQRRLQVRRIRHQGPRRRVGRVAGAADRSGCPAQHPPQPAATTPARSTSSPISACSAPRWSVARIWWRATTSMSAAARAPTRRSGG